MGLLVRPVRWRLARRSSSRGSSSPWLRTAPGPAQNRAHSNGLVKTSSGASNSETAGKPTPAPSDQPDVRWAKAGSIVSDEKANLPYGTPVQGKPGLVTSPFAPDAGYVQVISLPPGSPVEDPYTGEIFLTP